MNKIMNHRRLASLHIYTEGIRAGQILLKDVNNGKWTSDGT
jgi:hypothetical protein